MSSRLKFIRDAVFSIVVIMVFFAISLLVEKIFNGDTLAPAIFTLAVFLISLFTDGYLFGIVASLLSVLALNFAFAFPYFKFNFSIPENMVSAVIMLIITIMSSALATKVRKQEKVKAETEKEKMKANLLRAVSHDLRTPLTTIYGSSSTIADDLDQLDEAQIIELANGIREDSQWLIGMVENLLSITRIDNSNVKIIKTPIVLEELIDAVIIKFRKRYPGQEVEIDIPEEFISIPMDALLIEQVIENILENAVQHAVGMTKLGLKVYVNKNKAIFEISDDGCGIAKERLNNIFDGYFEKKDAPIDNQKSSMGIGLSVCSTIIKAHNGSIWTKNNKDKGSSFSFSLDMEVCDNEQ